MIKRYLIPILIIFFFINGAFSQIKTTGISIIKNYQKKTYKAGPQNWSIAQDQIGILYFANNKGILEYDGTTWKTYHTPNFSVVRSLLVSKTGKLYAGYFNDFALLTTDSSGNLQFNSYKHLIPKKYRNFSDIWKMYEIGDSLIFQSFQYLFILKNGKIEVIEPEDKYQFSFLVNDTYYIQDRNKGLLYLSDSKLKLCANSEIFINTEIWTMLPYNDKIIIGTANKGLYIYDGKSFYKWNIELNDFFIENQIFSGIVLKNKYFAIGTIQNGLVIIDKDGNLIQHINHDKGLNNNTILTMFSDKWDNLWLGLDNGIDFVEINSPFSYYNEGCGLYGAGYSTVIFDGNLYIGTNQGVFYMPWNDNDNKQIKNTNFKLVKNTKGQVWKLYVIDDVLICGHNYGTFSIKNDVAKQISTEKGAWTFIELKNHPKYVLQGSYTSLSLFEKEIKNKKAVSIKFKHKIKGFNFSSRYIQQDNDGFIWISHEYKGIYKLTLNNKTDSIINIVHYDHKQGLPSNSNLKLQKLDDNFCVTSLDGIYRYNKYTDLFEKDLQLNKVFENKNDISCFFKTPLNDVWFIQNNKLGLLKNTKGSKFKIEKHKFSQFDDSFVSSFEDVFYIDTKNVIISFENGCIHYDPSISTTPDTTFSILMRSVVCTSNTDTSLHKKVFSLKESTTHFSKLKTLKLPSGIDDIQFNFTSTFYFNSEAIEYKYYLENFDSKWSDWQTKKQKNYINLPSGTYVFHVKAKNIYDTESKEIGYRFKILPPWYKTIWAYLIYLIIAISSIFAGTRYITERIDTERKELEEKQKEELEKRASEFVKEAVIAEREIIRLKNEKLQSEITGKMLEGELKNKELATFAMQITNKNEILSTIKSQLEKISLDINDQAKANLGKLVKNIDENLRLDDDWVKFKLHFNEVHSGFFKRLKAKHLKLTPKDLKLCAYLRMNLATKEIAPLMNVSVRGLEVSRYRLRKKLGVSKEVNLIEFMINV